MSCQSRASRSTRQKSVRKPRLGIHVNRAMMDVLPNRMYQAHLNAPASWHSQDVCNCRYYAAGTYVMSSTYQICTAIKQLLFVRKMPRRTIFSVKNVIWEMSSPVQLGACTDNMIIVICKGCVRHRLQWNLGYQFSVVRGQSAKLRLDWKSAILHQCRHFGAKMLSPQVQLDSETCRTLHLLGA